MSEEICNHRWRAPRFDAPRSIDVEHVCARPRNHGFHDYEHKCSCGAVA